MTKVELDLYALVKGVARAFLGDARVKAVDLLVSIMPDVPRTVLGDPDGLRAVLVELLTNAVKFTSHGSVALHVAVFGDAGGARKPARWPSSSPACVLIVSLWRMSCSPVIGC